MDFLKKTGLDPFIVCLLAAILAAKLFPGPGTAGGPVTLGDAAYWGVGLVFFFYGLRLDRRKLLQGLSNARMHVLVHATTFVFFPLAVFCAAEISGGFKEDCADRLLWIGAYFLAALPSTVSSSVVMVSMAKGNVPAAVFDASMSGLLGVVATPLLMEAVPGDFGVRPAPEAATGIALQVLLPVALGTALNPKFGEWAAARKNALAVFDRAVILLIVYTSFCGSFAGGMFEKFETSKLLLLSLAVAALFFTAFFFLLAACGAMSFNRGDTVTAVFCGSKKSLAHATAMGKVLFSNSAEMGMVLLPVMLYHAMQLVIVSAVAQKWGKERRS